MISWDEYFVEIANLVRQKSKDPSSKIGAVIVDDDHQVLSTGFNGFPRKVREVNLSDSKLIAARWDEREVKYKFICHAESNAVVQAARTHGGLLGSTLYLVGFGPPTVPCIECTKIIIQAGIKHIKGCAYKPAREDWKDNLQFSYSMLNETGVRFTELAPLDQLDRS